MNSYTTLQLQQTYLHKTLATTRHQIHHFAHKLSHAQAAVAALAESRQRSALGHGPLVHNTQKPRDARKGLRQKRNRAGAALARAISEEEALATCMREIEHRLAALPAPIEVQGGWPLGHAWGWPDFSQVDLVAGDWALVNQEPWHFDPGPRQLPAPPVTFWDIPNWPIPSPPPPANNGFHIKTNNNYAMPTTLSRRDSGFLEPPIHYLTPQHTSTFDPTMPIYNHELLHPFPTHSITSHPSTTTSTLSTHSTLSSATSTPGTSVAATSTVELRAEAAEFCPDIVAHVGVPRTRPCRGEWMDSARGGTHADVSLDMDRVLGRARYDGVGGWGGDGGFTDIATNFEGVYGGIRVPRGRSQSLGAVSGAWLA